jgi:hypothetical protein
MYSLLLSIPPHHSNDTIHVDRSLETLGAIMTGDRFDFDGVFGEFDLTGSLEQIRYLALDHHELLIIVAAIHAQWPNADVVTRLHASQVCQERLAEMTKEHMLSFVRKLVAFHNVFHKE